MAKCSRQLTAFCGSLGQWCIFGVGYFTIFLACVLIGDVIYAIPALIIPAMTDAGSVFRWLHLGAFAWVSFGVYFNYFAACGTDGGVVPIDFVRFSEGEHAREADVLYCRRCQLPRPERCHHCSLCGRCVLKMDHHCPWINGCVGYYNQRYFAGFLIYLFLGTTYSALALAHVFWFHSAASAARYRLVTEGTMATFTFVLVGSIWCAMVFFVGWNGWLLVSNQTAVETHDNRVRARESETGTYRALYDLGPLANIAEVFSDMRCRLYIPFVGHAEVAGVDGGCLGILWMLTPSIQLMPGDGTAYPMWDYEIVV